MSRSRKKNPCITTCYGSNTYGKKICNKIFRHKSKYLIKIDKEPLHSLNEAMDEWDLGTDGLATYRTDLDETDMRK